MKETKHLIARRAAKEARRSGPRKAFKVRRTYSPVQTKPVLVADEKPAVVTAIVEKDDEQETHQIMRYLGKPQDRLKARARELEVIDVAPHETITFGSVKALEAYRRDLYMVNGEKTSHFRTRRQGMKLTIWRDG